MLDIFVLVKDRKEFTDLALRFLYEHTDFTPVNRLVFVDDSSIDGADEVCRWWIRKTGIGEIVQVRGGSVTNALFQGTEAFLDDPVDYLVKIDNDLILSENWLKKVLTQTELARERFDVVGFTVVNAFFPSTPEEIWTERAPEDYSLVEVTHTGGNFLMQWDVFRRFRNLGVTKDPAHYVVGSLSGVHRALKKKGLLRLAIIAPHLPVFKLDKVADRAFDRYEFFERREIDRRWVEERIEEYYLAGMCRKRLVAGRVVNAF